MKKIIKKGMGLVLATAFALSTFVAIAEAKTIRIVYRVTYGSQPTITFLVNGGSAKGFLFTQPLFCSSSKICKIN